MPFSGAVVVAEADIAIRDESLDAWSSRGDGGAAHQLPRHHEQRLQLLPSMKFSHLIRQRAFARRQRPLRLKQRPRTSEVVARLQKLVKGFDVVPHDSSCSSAEHVSERQVTCLSNGHASGSQPSCPDDANLFSQQFDDVVVVRSECMSKLLADGRHPSAVAAAIEKMLLQTLASRVLEVACRFTTCESKMQLMIGFVVDPKGAFETVTRGPSANEPSASSEFRKLWGDWSECRRFPDLETCEAVAFPAANLAEKRNIIYTIIEHTLKLHFKISCRNVSSLSPQLNSWLKPPSVPVDVYGSGEEVCARISSTLEELIKKMRQLKSLPLAITAVQGTSPGFRGSEVWPPLATSVPCYLEAVPRRILDVIISFESTGKWPDDLLALRAVKFQMIQELCSKIRQQLGVATRIAASYFDAHYDGYIFRFHPSIKKELLLLRQVVSEKGVLVPSIESSAEAERLFVRNELLPKLTSALNGINTRFVAYGAACRLVKRWISSQYMEGYVDDLLVELLVTHAFVSRWLASPLSCVSSRLLTSRRNPSWSTWVNLSPRNRCLSSSPSTESWSRSRRCSS